MNQVEFDKTIFKEAKDYLIKHTPKEVTKKVVESYFTMSDKHPRKTMKIEGPEGFYHEILDSAQNNNMRAQVIGGSMKNGLLSLQKVLFDFDPKKVLDQYKGKLDILLDDIEKKAKPKGKFRREKNSIWPKYCETIISAAEFFSQFKNSKELLEWIDFFYNDNKSIAALPLILSSEIAGIGFALACDFLKDLGYNKYGKPDTHVKGIFEGVGLLSGKVNDYKVLKAITRVANNVKLTPFAVDKVFYLLGSGSFHMHPQIGEKGKVERLKNDFIKYMEKKDYKLD